MVTVDEGRHRERERERGADYSLQKLDDSCPARDNYVRCINVWCAYRLHAYV